VSGGHQKTLKKVNRFIVHEILVIVGEWELHPTLSIVRLISSLVVVPVHGVGEAVVSDDVGNAGDGEEEGDDPRHPSERHDGGQESTGAVSAAPSETSELVSEEGGTDDPQDEEDQETN
jgi:hypothetical protein